MDYPLIESCTFLVLVSSFADSHVDNIGPGWDYYSKLQAASQIDSSVGGPNALLNRVYLHFVRVVLTFVAF